MEREFKKMQEKDYELFNDFCNWFKKLDFRQRHYVLSQLEDLHLSLILHSSKNKVITFLQKIKDNRR